MHFSNRDRFVALYDKADRLFQQLVEFQVAWKPFVTLGCINLDDLCDVYLKTRDDWDKNFKACKQFSQQIAKIPGHVCVVIWKIKNEATLLNLI